MNRFIYKIILFLILTLNKIILKFFKKNILIHFQFDFRQRSFFEKKVLMENLKLLNTNPLTNFRYKNMLNGEEKTIKWIDSFKKQNSKKIIFYDIGSCLGNFSIYASVKHKKNIVIYSFEPSPQNLNILVANITKNKLNNIIVIPNAVIDENKVNTVYENENFEGSARRSFKYNKGYDLKKINYKSKYQTFGINIFNLIKDKVIEKPNFIKIDVDGNEIEILKTIEPFIKSKIIKSICIELNSKKKNRYDYAINLFKKYNYKLIGTELTFKDKKNLVQNYIYSI